MPGTVVEAITSGHGYIEVITLTCTADAAAATFPATALTNKFSGYLVALETNPGSTAPTDNYDIVLNDAEGNDVLQGVGANRHTTTTQKVPVVYSGTALHPVVHATDTLTWTITNNAVNSAVVVAKLYIQMEGR